MRFGRTSQTVRKVIKMQIQINPENGQVQGVALDMDDVRNLVGFKVRIEREGKFNLSGKDSLSNIFSQIEGCLEMSQKGFTYSVGLAKSSKRGGK